MKVKKISFLLSPHLLKRQFHPSHLHDAVAWSEKDKVFLRPRLHSHCRQKQTKFIFFARMTFVFYFLVSKVSFIVDRNWIYIPCFSKLPPSWQYCYIAWDSREYATNTTSNNGRNKHTDTIEGTTSQWPVTLKGQWLGGKPGEWREWQNIQTDININF